MRYVKKLGLFASAIVLALTFMAVNTSAQVRIGVQLGRGYYRPPVRRYYAPRYYAPPVVTYGYGYGNPYWNRSDRYYDRRNLNSDRNHLRKDANKYYSDGYITPHEQENLYKDRQRIYRDRNRVRNDW